MAKRGSQKQWSIDQENTVAYHLVGERTKNSGATDKQKGDVLAKPYLVECKFAGSPIKPAKSISIKLSDWEKIHDEATASSLLPLMHIRFRAHDSILSDYNGNVDAYVLPAHVFHALYLNEKK